MEIFESIGLLAIFFAATFCSMEIIWRLHLRINADESKEQEKRKNFIIKRESKANSTGFPFNTY
ncbi:MAG TPA: hypothetical protein VEL70_02465 [Candidatus Acidoferrum sp.]|nr:hypothetical protein [Candidatus Acidoferrum sp.]